jgi:hypothetical protein
VVAAVATVAAVKDRVAAAVARVRAAVAREAAARAASVARGLGQVGRVVGRRGSRNGVGPYPPRILRCYRSLCIRRWCSASTCSSRKKCAASPSWCGGEKQEA